MTSSEITCGWEGARREFRQVQGRKHILTWAIRVEGATETTWYGVLNGQLQTTSNTYKGVNVGKANEVTDTEYALDRAERKILMKRREGYVEFCNGQPIEEPSQDAIVPGRPLPRNVCFYKPDNTVGAGMLKKIREGRAVFTRKRDGLMHVIRTTEDEVEIYSRRMMRSLDKEPKRTWEERFPHLYEEVLTLLLNGTIPPHSLLLGDLIVDRKGKDDFEHVESITKSLTPKALKDQEAEGYASFYVWDIAFWGGEDVISTRTVAERYGTITESFKGSEWVLPIDVWTPAQIWEEGMAAFATLHSAVPIKPKTTFPTAVFHTAEGELTIPLEGLAIALAVQRDWEGWVVVDPRGIYGDRAYTFRGHPDRPGAFCSKLKPVFELDAIAYWDPDRGIGTWGTGKNQGQVGSLALFQLNSNYEEVYLCDVGSGLSDERRIELANPALYPLVVKVLYNRRTFISRGDKTNALTIPRFVAVRDDKDPEECVEPLLD